MVEVQTVLTPENGRRMGTPKMEVDGENDFLFLNLGGFLRFQPLIESGVFIQCKLGLKIHRGAIFFRNLQRVRFCLLSREGSWVAHSYLDVPGT